MTYEPDSDDVSIEFITPEDAAAYLDLNESNRWLKSRKLDAFIRDMENGDWLWNGETLKFDRQGKLIDGQHRLEAVVKSGKGQWFLVVYNVEREARSTIDTGSARTFGDTLKMRGYLDAQLLAGTARLLWLWEQGERTFRASRQTPTIAELLKVLDAHPDLPNVTRPARNLSNHSVLTPSASGFVIYMLNKISPEDCEDFFSKFRSLADLPEDSPILVLRKALDSLYSKMSGNSAYMMDTQIAFVFKAWNRYRNGEPMRTMRFTPGGVHPEAFPEPH